jgi:uncharacterized protein (TIGR03435 family)
MFRMLCAAVFGLTMFGPCAISQDKNNQDMHALSFDVSTVRPNKSGGSELSIDFQLNTFTATNVTVKMLLENAYGVRQDSIAGKDGWIETAHFDVHAKATEGSPSSFQNLPLLQRRAMLQKLLANRFHLQTHFQEKEGLVYDLTVAKGGPKLKKVSPQSKVNGVENGGMSVADEMMTAHDVPLSKLTYLLSNQLQRNVVDDTGLQGNYDIVLTWRPDKDFEDAEQPTIFTVLQEQLGLRLERAKGPIKTLVIDKIETPTEN